MPAEAGTSSWWAPRPTNSFQPVTQDCLAEASGQKVEETFPGDLDHEVRCARVHRFHSNGGVIVAGNEDDRRMLILRNDFVEHLPSALAGHVIVDRDHVEQFVAHPRQPFVSAFCGFDLKTALGQCALNQPPQPGVIIDIQDTVVGYWPSASGTWITARNSPSCRIASAKLS